MRLLVIGAGGHAKVVVDAALAAGIEVAGILGDAGGRAEILGIPVSFDAAALSGDAFIAAIGDNAARAAAYEAWLAKGLPAASVIHPSAVIARDVVIGDGSLVAAGAVVNTGTRVGANAVVNTGCRVDHDCRIGDHALVGPGASLCGGVSVGTGTLLGVGACVVPGACLGEWSVVGAGAAVVADVPARTVVGGVPAAELRKAE